MKRFTPLTSKIMDKVLGHPTMAETAYQTEMVAPEEIIPIPPVQMDDSQREKVTRTGRRTSFAIEWEKIYYEVRVAPAPRHPSPGGWWLAPFQIARGNRARASDLARARRVRHADRDFRLCSVVFFFLPLPWSRRTHLPPRSPLD